MYVRLCKNFMHMFFHSFFRHFCFFFFIKLIPMFRNVFSLWLPCFSIVISTEKFCVLLLPIQCVLAVGNMSSGIERHYVCYGSV